MIVRIPPTVRPPTLEEVSDANPGWKVEREADGSITMSPTGSSQRWRSLSPAERLDYGGLIPDVCIEVVSKTDNPMHLIEKLQRYRGYGAAYVLLIDPFGRSTWCDGVAPDGFPTDFTSVFDAGLE